MVKDKQKSTMKQEKVHSLINRRPRLQASLPSAPFRHFHQCVGLMGEADEGGLGGGRAERPELFTTFDGQTEGCSYSVQGELLNIQNS